MQFFASNNGKSNETCKPIWLHAYGCTSLCCSVNNVHGTGYERRPGGRLNKKDGLTKYGDSHVKDKTS